MVMIGGLFIGKVIVCDVELCDVVFFMVEVWFFKGLDLMVVL